MQGPADGPATCWIIILPSTVLRSIPSVEESFAGIRLNFSRIEMKLYLSQLNPTVGDVDGNFERILSAYREASKNGADLVVCPEMAAIGYPPRDLLDRREVTDHLEKALLEFASEIGETGLLLGTVRPNPDPTGRPLINAAVLLSEGQVKETWRKTLLPSYDVFDEERYFEPSTECTPYEFRGNRLGITVCEDIWNRPMPKVPHVYHRNPVEEIFGHGADLLINISASPFHAGKISARLEVLLAIAKQYRWPVVYVNQVGANDDLIFDGQSLVVNADGEVIACGAAFEEDLIPVELETTSSVEFNPLDETKEVVEALCLGIRDYLRKTGFKTALIGLSGGIDSSVVACLAARALGQENVWGIAMPSQFNLSASLEDAQMLSKNLEIRFNVLAIEDIFQQFLTTLKPVFNDLPFNVAEENTQARIRGNLLMALSNKFGHILLTTGNKSELAVGYCTLYGDMCGGLAVISDVPKEMVYEIARWFNRDGEVIPERIITRPPSAELRPDQKDQDSLPPYDVLDRILKAFVEEGRSGDELVADGHDPEVVDHVLRLINLNDYKRNQAAPGLRVTTKAFGGGRRMPIAKSAAVLSRRK